MELQDAVPEEGVVLQPLFNFSTSFSATSDVSNVASTGRNYLINQVVSINLEHVWAGADQARLTADAFQKPARLRKRPIRVVGALARREAAHTRAVRSERLTEVAAPA